MSELMEVDDVPAENEHEEGELTDSDDDQKVTTIEYKNNVGGFTTGFDVFDQEEDIKRLERAKRFAIENESPTLNREVLGKLYESLGIDSENILQYRLNSVHMRGTEDMSTADVFNYFKAFAAASIEWINDVSCNVVWLDDISAARALLGSSVEIKNLDKFHGSTNPFIKKEILTSGEVKEDTVDASKLDFAVPPGSWRFGNPHSKSKNILLRFALKSDKKQPNAQRNSEYYKKHGNPRFGNTPGILTENLRAKRKEITDKKNPWGDLAEKWGGTEEVIETRVLLKRPLNDLRNSLSKRIKIKREINDEAEEGDSEEKRDRIKREINNEAEEGDSEEERDRIKRPRMKMRADEEEKKIQKRRTRPGAVLVRLNQTLSERKIIEKPRVTDLRNLLGSKKKEKQGYILAETSKGVWTKVVRNEDEEKEEEEERKEKEQAEESSDSDSGSSNSSDSSSSSSASNSSSSSSDSSSSSSSEDSGKESRTSRSRFKTEKEETDGRWSPLQIQIDNDQYFESN